MEAKTLEVIKQPLALSGPDKPEVLRAKKLYDDILARREMIAGGYLDLGEMFLEIRDKEYYKLLGHDSFASFYGSPEISFAKTTVYAMIDIYKLLILECKYKREKIAEIPWSKLNMVKALFKETKDEDLLFQAKELSQKDLIDVINIRRKRKPQEYTPPGHERPNLLDYDDYVEFVKAYGCLLCSNPQADPHHFPKTKGAGAPDHWVIPLCRKCHSEHQEKIEEFLKTYRNKIFKYFYDIILTIYRTIREEDDG